MTKCYSYEVLICVIKKVGSDAFLSFAGIGPYHVSESPEKAIEETAQYFPRVSVIAEEVISDEEGGEGLEDYEEEEEHEAA